MKIELVACDLHPDYTSTRLAEAWAAERNLPLVRVQHHHAHFAACLAENRVEEPAIGVILDGTGYGTNGKIWGGEVLIGEAMSYRRFAHLAEIPMPGGEWAVREPWRMAAAWLNRVYGESWIDLDLPFVIELRRKVGRPKLVALTEQRLMDSFYLTTTSMGRLFDAVSAMAGFGVRSQYEGQAAMELEWLSDEKSVPEYQIGIDSIDHEFVLNPASMFEEIIYDIRKRKSFSYISTRFHKGIIEAMSRICFEAKKATGLSTVALSGGCFQNAFLLTHLMNKLEGDGFRVVAHSRIPCNDGGVSLGQAVIANEQTGE